MSASRASGVHFARGGSTCRRSPTMAHSWPRASFSRLSECQSPPFAVACQKHCGVRWAWTSMLRIAASCTCYPASRARTRRGHRGESLALAVRLRLPAPPRGLARHAAGRHPRSRCGDRRQARGGGGLRNLGPHGLDLFLFLTGDDATVTGAQLSASALGQPVEDYASVLLRSTRGILGTIEVGNTFPRAGTDAEWKVAGRDAMVQLRDGTIRLTTGESEEVTAGEPAEPPALTALRDALDCWHR